MTGFEFDGPPSPGTNRTAPITDCPTCDGDRFVPVPDDKHEVYARCPACNPAPLKTREPVQAKGWWKE